jgi:uncharacterized integral membrane protein
MSKSKIIALVLIGLCALVLLTNVGMWDDVTVKLLFGTVNIGLSFVLLGTLAVGVLIGVLFK